MSVPKTEKQIPKLYGMYSQPMVKVALKRDRSLERIITKKSYDLNSKAYILLDGQVQETKKNVEKVADADEPAVEKNKGGRPRKQPEA